MIKNNVKQKSAKPVSPGRHLGPKGQRGIAGATDNILLAIDDSVASRKAIAYVAALARRQKGLGIHIFHAIDPLPTQLQEFRGAENPDDEKTLENELKLKQHSWHQEVNKCRRTAHQKNPIDAGTSWRCTGANQFPHYCISASRRLARRDFASRTRFRLRESCHRPQCFPLAEGTAHRPFRRTGERESSGNCRISHRLAETKM